MIGNNGVTNWPSVSAVVVNYNAGQYLESCIRSLLPQVDEILIVDNCSTDGSLNIFINQYSSETKLKIIRNDSNLGFAAACNIGINHVRGGYILFLNPDCIIEDHVVTHLAEALGGDASIGMVGGLLLNPDGTEQGGSRRAIPTPWRSFVRAFGLNHFADRWPKLFFDFYLYNQPLPQQPIEVEAVSGACMMVKQTAIKEVGLWDDGYFLHCEDLDWCMRFHQSGHKVMFVPHAKVLHSLGVCSRSRPIFVEWHKHRGMIRFYKNHFRRQYPGVLMWLVVIGVWLRFGMVITRHGIGRLVRASGVQSA